MLGIPTQSDVTDSEFQEMLRQEKINDGLHVFDSCFSSCLVHNHVVGAFRPFLSVYPIGREFTDFASDLPISLLKVNAPRDYLEPDKIARIYLDRISEARAAVKDATEFLKGKKTNVFQEDVREIDVWVKVNALLDAFESSIVAVIVSNYGVRKRAKALYEIVKAFDENPEKRALWPLDFKTGIQSTWFSCIGGSNTEAQRLYKENSDLADSSDIFLRFDERYIIRRIKTARGHSDYMFPMTAFVEVENRTSGHYLSQRTAFRDIIREIIYSDSRCVIINGHMYEVTTIDISNTPQFTSGLVDSRVDILTCSFNADSSQMLANILGFPIRRFCEDSYAPYETTFPEIWVNSEMKLVESYRSIPVDKVLPNRIMVRRTIIDRLLRRNLEVRYEEPYTSARTLLDLYNVYGYGLVNDPKERYEVLLQLFRKKDWDKLNGREERVLSESGVSCG